MTLQQEALRTVELLPNDKLPTLIAFARFLRQADPLEPEADSSADTLAQKRRSVAGILRGQMRMAEDFDETPDIFKEYL